MKHVARLFHFRGGVPRALAVVLGAFWGAAAHGGNTEISTSPIISTVAAQVRPNIMLLMDASGSMARSHMPDEVETITGSGSIGYKNWQCNALYYNPALPYAIPKDHLKNEFQDNGNQPFVASTFDAAPYAGFVSYYTTPDATDRSVVDLRTSFVAFDSKSLYQESIKDTPQPAYYYLYSGTQALHYASAPCMQKDVNTSVAATGGGNWTRVVVGATSGPGGIDERKNFAVWYSFYRTRISLMKSAASLAFEEISSSYRVGLVTVQPKDNSPSAPFDATDKYLAIDTFGPLQRENWFKKLFAQSPGGASPTREGLARVGRHYAGKQDGINAGMTGDPVQHSCQQNFTILTTDGYWNAQTESTNGGGVKLDGTKVGQQDGKPTCLLTSAFCPRPIWDGGADSVQVSTTKSNAYSFSPCSGTGFLESKTQTTKTEFSFKRDYTRTDRQTIQKLETKVQHLAATTRHQKTVTQTRQATLQLAESSVQTVNEKYQIERTVMQMERAAVGNELTTSQVWKEVQKVVKTDTQIDQTKVLWTRSTSQNILTKEQYAQGKWQYTEGTEQKVMTRSQTFEINTKNEKSQALSRACVPDTTLGITCETKWYEVNKPVFAADCIAGYDSNNFLTVCNNGPLYAAAKPVQVCNQSQVTDNTNKTVTTCSYTRTAADVNINGTCSGNTQASTPDYTITTCVRPPANNSPGTPIGTCPAPLAYVGPDWIKQTCGPGGPNTATVYSAPCADSYNGTTYITTTCKEIRNEKKTVAVCEGNEGIPELVVTCTPKTLSSAEVDGRTCVGKTVGTVVTACTPTPITASQPAASCSPGFDGTFTTYCTWPAATNRTEMVKAADCFDQTANGTNQYITKSCIAGKTTKSFTPPAPSPLACVAGFDGLETVTCTPIPGAGQKPAPASSCGVPGQLGQHVGPGPAYIITTCTAYGTTNAPAGCKPSVTISETAPYYVTICMERPKGTVPVETCVPGTSRMGADFTEISCVKQIDLNEPVASCKPDVKTLANKWVDISCPAVVTVSGPTDVDGLDPLQCPNPAPPVAGPDYHQTTCTSTPVSGPTPVASCKQGFEAGTGLTTTCSYPAATNYVDKGVQACAFSGTTTTKDGTFITTTCLEDDRTVPILGSACKDDPVPSASNGWKKVICKPTTVVGEATPSCPAVLPSSSAVSPFETTTACTSTAPVKTNVASCSHPPTVGGSPPYLHTVCGLAPILPANQPVAACPPNAGPDATGVVTTCIPNNTGGYKFSVVTTTVVTTTPYSNKAPAGLPKTSTSSTTPAEVDGVCHATNTPPTAQPIPPDPCTAWPCVSTVAGPAGSENSLADVAQYYYTTDLRNTGRPKDASDPETLLDENNVPSIGPGDEDDNAPHQHMTTFVVGLGVSGTLTYHPEYRSHLTTVGDFADIRKGRKDWPIWPDPALTYANPLEYDNPKSIDDFWHTAVNGRGTYFSAQDPTSVIQGLSSALAGITARVGSGAADGASSFEPVAGNNYVYTTSYQTGSWQGDLKSFEIDLTTGALSTQKWSAQALLNSRVSKDCDSRNIYLLRPGATTTLVDFTWDTTTCVGGVRSGVPTGLDAAEKDAFNAATVSSLSQFKSVAAPDPAGTGPKLVNFIRGQREHEGFVSKSTDKLFRTRVAVLGDLVGSQPVYVKAPFASYTDLGYLSFRTSNANRTPMVYVGGNDGMLHAFYATDTLADTVPALHALRGEEKWAVIPSAVLPKLYQLADTSYDKNHQFYVDGTPVVGDVNDGGTWKTILVGGLNAGGEGYYAIDVTDPSADPKALWEFKRESSVCPSLGSPTAAAGNKADCNLGLTFGKPIITKLPVGGVSTWVVMVTSGYNNTTSAFNGGEGGGFLYVLKAMTGEVIYKIGTGRGTAADPSGLAQINNYVDNVMYDNTTVRAYGGDLLGNVWRFEFGATPTARLLGTAKSNAGNAQPITVRPELAELEGKPVVFIGTGKLLGASDVVDIRGQSIYGIADDPAISSTPVVAANLRTALRQLKMTQTGSGSSAVRQSGACAANCSGKDGWVVDLPDTTGERVNIEMKLVLGTLVVGTNVPEPVSCSVGGKSWLNYFDFRSGEAVATAPLVNPGTPADGQIVSQFLGDSLIGGFNIMKLPPVAGFPDGKYVASFHMGDNSHVEKVVPTADQAPTGKRISWREIAR